MKVVKENNGETWYNSPVRRIRIISGRDPDICEIRCGGGYIAVLGAPFFLAGLFIAQVPFGFIPVEVEVNPLVLAIVFPVGVAFAGAGLLLILSRSGFTIDRRKGTITRWWGLPLPLKKTRHPISSYTSVVLTRYPEGEGEPPESYPVTLVSGSVSDEFVLFDSEDYVKARQVALEIGRFLGKPVRDSVGGSEIFPGNG